MKKAYQKLFFVLFMVSIFCIKANARSLTLKEIVERVDSKTDTIYIIGNHVFANHDISLQDIMVGSRTIKVDREDENFGSDYKQDEVYKAMNIYRVSLEKNPKENFKVVGAKVDNLVGTTSTTLSWDSDNKMEIDNINYDFVKEESKAQIELYNSGTHTNYQEYFNGKQFTTNNEVNLDNYALSKTVYLDQEHKITPEGEKTDYYLGVVVKIDAGLKDKITDQTTIWYGYTNDKASATKKVKNEFTDEEGIPILWSVKEDTSDKHLYIWVDIDGDGNTYETTQYVLDYTGLTFQKVSSGTISKDIDVEENWNYTLDNANLEYQSSDQINYTVTGKVNKQQGVTITETEKSGYYLPFKITTKEAYPKMSIKWEGDGQSNNVTVQEKNTYSFLYPIKNTSIGEDRKCTNCTITITIDFDGEEGNDYLPQKYTINCTDVTFPEDSSIQLDGLEQKIIENKESDGKYYFNVKVTPTAIKEGTTIKVTDPNGKVENYTEASPVAEVSKSVTITKQENAYELKLEAMKEFEITSENPKKAYQIEIDIDGDEELYAASTYAINYDQIKTLEEEINNYAKKTQDAKSLKQTIKNQKDGVSENLVEVYSKESNSKLVYFQDGKDVENVYYFEYAFPTEGLPENIQSWAGHTVHFAFTKYKSKVESSNNQILTDGSADVYLNGWLYRKLSGGLGVDILGILQDETIRQTDGSYTKIRAIENIEKQPECEGATSCYKVTLTKNKVETWLNDHYSEGRQTHTVGGPKAVMIKVNQDGYVVKVDSVGDDTANEWKVTYQDSNSEAQQIKRTIDVEISNINEEQSDLKDPETMVMGSKSPENQKLFFEFIALGEKLWQQHVK